MFVEPSVELDTDLVTEGHKRYVGKARRAMEVWNAEVKDSLRVKEDDTEEKIAAATKTAQEVRKVDREVFRFLGGAIFYKMQ